MSEEIESSRMKAIFLALGCAAFVGIGFWALQKEQHVEFWMCATLVLFGFGLSVATILLLRPMKLHLDDYGFTISGGVIWHARRVLWAEVELFTIIYLPREGKIIGYNFKPNVRKPTLWMSLNRSFGAHASLPKLWPGKPEDLVDKLNSYRASWEMGF